MGAEAHHDWRAAAAGLLDWWRAAGVDAAVADAPLDWLATPPLAPAPPTPAPASLVTDLALPGDLAAFAAWRGGAGAPEHGWPGEWPGAWVVASGPADAALLVLADCPDRACLAAGTLLAGEAGRLFDRMLAAIGLAREAVHLAAVCGKRPAAGRVPPGDADRLAALARHHAGLVAPRALLLLGGGASRALLGLDLPAARGRPHRLDHAGGRASAVIATHHPRFLLEKPAAKAGAWTDLRALRRALAG